MNKEEFENYADSVVVDIYSDYISMLAHSKNHQRNEDDNSWYVGDMKLEPDTTPLSEIEMVSVASNHAPRSFKMRYACDGPFERFDFSKRSMKYGNTH